MPSRRYPAPTCISAQATAFIDAAEPLASVDLAPAAMAERRRAIGASMGPGGEAVQRALGVSVRQADIAGVPVQWIEPQGGGAGVVLYFFGGGYITGSPEEDLAITVRLAQLSGARVCAPRYRLAPEHPYPAAVEDGWAVYQALAGKHMALAGESAGGNLCLVLMRRAADQGVALPAAVALLSPWCDLTHQGDTIRTLDGLDPTLDYPSQLSHMSKAYAAGHALDAPEISPLFAAVPPGFPPALISSGTRDLLLSDCARLAAKLRRAGVSVDMRVAEGMWHVFEYYPELPEALESLQGIAAFLRRHLDRQGA